MNLSAELGSLLVILSFACLVEPYRWRITVDAKDVGFFRAPNRSVLGSPKNCGQHRAKPLIYVQIPLIYSCTSDFFHHPKSGS